MFRKPNLPKRPRSAPPSSRYTDENPQIVRTNFRVRPNIYSQPVIVYNGQTHPLPTTDIRPVPSDVLLKPENVLQYTVDDSYLQTLDFNNKNNKNNQNNNRRRKSNTNTTITNNNNNYSSQQQQQNQIEDDVIIEDIDEEDIDNIIPVCNRITYDENIFNNTQLNPPKQRPNSARPSSARRRKYIDNNNTSLRPQSAIPIVTPQYIYIYIYSIVYI